MIFGDGFEIPASTQAADWLDAAPTEDWFTAGWLVTTSYPAYLRCHPPDSDVEDWGLAYREFFEAITGVGARHTSTPDRAWFGIWEGHGFASGITRVSWSTPAADDAETARRAAVRARKAEESVRENARVQAELDRIPRFGREERAFYLLSAALTAVSNVRWPGREYWHQPDLVWPDDRSWCAGTDVDFWSVYVGGSETFISELAQALDTPTEIIPPTYRIPTDEG